jgi:hypothetical protein
VNYPKWRKEETVRAAAAGAGTVAEPQAKSAKRKYDHTKEKRPRQQLSQADDAILLI